MDWPVWIVGAGLPLMAFGIWQAHRWRDLRLVLNTCIPATLALGGYFICKLAGLQGGLPLYFFLCAHIATGIWLVVERLLQLRAMVRISSRSDAILESAVDGIIIIDHRGIIILNNPAIERLFGYASEELRGQNVSQLMPDPYRREHDEYIHRFRETRVPRIIGRGREVIGLHRDGHQFPLYLAISEIYTDGKQFFVGNLHDLSDLKKVEREKERERNVLQAILDTAGALLIVLDTHSRIVNFNRASEILTGYSIDEVRRRPVQETIIPTEELQKQMEMSEKLMASGQPIQFEGCILTRIGERRLIQWSHSLLINDQGDAEYIVATGIDITEKRRQQAELEILSSRLIQIRDEERNLIAADIHDGLGQSLIALKFMVDELRHRTRADAEMQKISSDAMDLINQAVDEGRELSHLLSPIALKKIGLSHALRELVQSLRGAPGIELQLDGLDSCFADGWDTNLYRLVQEALQNVLKHADASKVQVQLDRSRPESLCIRVVDDGIGFDPIQTSAENGIGLLLMRARAQYLGGRIHIISRPGSGTEIQIVIPSEQISRGPGGRPQDSQTGFERSAFSG